MIKAIDIVGDIDKDDALFVALAIETNSRLWTGDKVLYSGLKSFGFIDVVNTKEVVELYYNYK